MTCPCACHTTSGVHKPRCTIDRGTSGVPGLPSCSPCDPGSDRPVVAHDGSAAEVCVLPHVEAAPRHVGRLCARHWHQLLGTLRQVEELYALLPATLLPRVGEAGGRSATRVGSPAPGRLEVMAVTDRRMLGSTGRDDDVPNVPEVVTGWAEAVAEQLGRPVRVFADPVGPVCRPQWVVGQRLLCPHNSCQAIRRPWQPPLTVAEALRFLRAHRKWVAAQFDDVDEMLVELGEVQQALAAAVGDSMWPTPIGRCPNCQARLYNQPDRSGLRVDRVVCFRCKTEWQGAALARLRLIHEQEVGT